MKFVDPCVLLPVSSDIKTEDGLSHSPGQNGLLGYSNNFSGTPPSQSLYSYSAHGQSLHLLPFCHLHDTFCFAPDSSFFAEQVQELSVNHTYSIGQKI